MHMHPDFSKATQGGEEHGVALANSSRTEAQTQGKKWAKTPRQSERRWGASDPAAGRKII